MEAPKTVEIELDEVDMKEKVEKQVNADADLIKGFSCSKAIHT